MIRRPPRSPLFPYPPLFRSRCEQTVVPPPHRGAVSGASSGPNREDKRFTSPALPFVAEVITVRIGTGRGELKRRIADHEDGLVRQRRQGRSEEHTSELQSQSNLVCRLLLETKKNN